MSVDALNELLGDELPDAPMDGWGRRLIKMPDVEKPKAFTRVTTFIKAVSGKDGDGLRDFHGRYVAKGLIDDPELMQLVLDNDADPDDPDTKKKLNRALNAAAVRAGRDRKRDQGTAIHDAIARTIAGRPTVSHPDVDGPVAEFMRLVRVHNLSVVASEQIVVNLTYRVSGRFDLVCDDGSGPAIYDVKTGTLDFSVPEFGPQLYLYASADTIYDPLAEEHRPMLEVSQDHAFIIHVPRDGSEGGIYRVGLDGCKEMCDMALEVRAWPRKAKKQWALVEPSAAPAVDVEADRHEWVKERLAAVAEMHGARRVLREWDVYVGPDVPTPKDLGDGRWTDEQIDKVAGYCDLVEKGKEADFGPSDPALPEPTPWPQVEAPTHRLTVPEGGDGPGDAELLLALRRRLEADDALKAVVSMWGHDAARDGVNWLPGKNPTERQAAIARAAVVCAENLHDFEADSDDVVRAALHAVTGDDICEMPSFRVGSLIGTLTLEQADQLATFAQTAKLRIDGSGKPRFVV